MPHICQSFTVHSVGSTIQSVHAFYRSSLMGGGGREGWWFWTLPSGGSDVTTLHDGSSRQGKGRGVEGSAEGEREGSLDVGGGRQLRRFKVVLEAVLTTPFRRPPGNTAVGRRRARRRRRRPRRRRRRTAAAAAAAGRGSAGARVRCAAWYTTRSSYRCSRTAWRCPSPRRRSGGSRCCRGASRPSDATRRTRRSVCCEVAVMATLRVPALDLGLHLGARGEPACARQ